MSDRTNYAKELGSDLIQKTRLAIRRLAILAIILTASVPLMWLINISGYGEWNFIPFFLGAAVTLAVALRLDTILLALGLGTAHGALTDWKLSGSLPSGARTWYKVTTGTLSVFLATAGLLAIHPWQESPISFWIFVAAILVVISFLEYHELKLRNLKLFLILGYASVVSIYALWSTIPSLWHGKVFDTITGEPLVMMEPDGSWIDYDRGPQDCQSGCYSPFTGKKLVPITPKVAQKHGKWPTPTTQTERPRVAEPVLIQARDSGQIIAPVSTYSAWLKIPQNKCIHWWTNEPEPNDVRTKYISASGVEWRGDSQEEPVLAQA